MELIRLQNIAYSNGDYVIFDDMNAEFHAGETVAVIGDVGSGRSDLLNIITGVLLPDSGSVHLFGNDIAGIGTEQLNDIRQRIGFVFQNSALISNLKVIENVTLPLLYHTDRPLDEVYRRGVDLLNAVGYNEDIWVLPGLLPAFRRRAVAYARSMALDPDILIYDRFLEGLDPKQREFMISLAEGNRSSRKGRLSIFTANHIDELAGISFNRLLAIKQNRLVEYNG